MEIQVYGCKGAGRSRWQRIEKLGHFYHLVLSTRGRDLKGDL